MKATRFLSLFLALLMLTSSRAACAAGTDDPDDTTTITDEKLDKVGAVLEAMGSASYRIVKPVYYETTLRTKLVSDPQSSEMLDLIVENIRIDAGYIYVNAFDNFHHGFREIITGGINNTTSLYASKIKFTEKKIKSLNVKLAQLAEKNE